MPPLRDATVELPDGRRLAFTEWGVAAGRPVLVCHGKPGSRLWCPDEDATRAAGVRLIIPDRPGIGRSDPLEGRTLGDWPTDVVALADLLDLGMFGVVGASGGAPYGLACAALIPDRLTHVADISNGFFERDGATAPELVARWPPRMLARLELASRDRMAAAELSASQWLDEIQFDWDPAVARRELEAAEGDRWYFDEPARVASLEQDAREWSRQGADGVKWDLMDLVQPWGFRLADIRVPVSIWHGAQDPWVSRGDVEAERRLIPHSRLTIWPDAGHLGVAKHWGDILGAVS